MVKGELSHLSWSFARKALPEPIFPTFYVYLAAFFVFPLFSGQKSWDIMGYYIFCAPGIVISGILANWSNERGSFWCLSGNVCLGGILLVDTARAIYAYTKGTIARELQKKEERLTKDSCTKHTPASARTKSSEMHESAEKASAAMEATVSATQTRSILN
ncbi:hypothetical protein KIPB_005903 [Kipferlia bialata]|uniref:Uncharacterized protein n=1 Tax=Kipferlia bialata TaxID=797122 RepID=A0A9K3GIN8_9EUKA|nr:hypothetical protein KIPB_005903 [Kipferlia bialata]|eukprot:g5903.t1